MTTQYDQDINTQVKALNQRYVNLQRINGRADDLVGKQANKSYQIYHPQITELRYHDDGKSLLGGGASIWEQMMPFETPISDDILPETRFSTKSEALHNQNLVDNISQGAGGIKKYKKKGGTLKLEGGGWDSFWDSVGNGISDTASDVWNGVKDAAGDLADNASNMAQGALNMASDAVEHPEKIMSFVAENPELLAGLGKASLFGENLVSGKKTSKWIDHVKTYALTHKMSYRDALRNKMCKDTYAKQVIKKGKGKIKKGKGASEDVLNAVKLTAEKMLKGGKFKKGKGASEDVLNDVKLTTEKMLKGGYWNTMEGGVNVSNNHLQLGGSVPIPKKDKVFIYHHQLGGKAKKTSKWIEHVKSFASKNKISYRDALRDKNCKDTYKK